MTPISFAMRGVVPVGYAVFALLLGTLVGLVLRRSVAAMAVTLAVYVFVQIAVPLWVRPHLLPPVTSSTVISRTTLAGIGSDGSGPFQISTHTGDPRDWILTNQTVDAQGRATALPSWFGTCLPPPPSSGTPSGKTQVTAGPGTLEDCFTRLADEGYRQHMVYQPYTHFWRLQWAETGLYLAASGVLAGLSFWWTRRRVL